MGSKSRVVSLVCISSSYSVVRFLTVRNLNMSVFITCCPTSSR